jgi:DNA polymerase-1
VTRVLYLVELSNFLFRHHFTQGNATLARESDGHPIGAVSGCCGDLWRLAQKRPAHAAVVMDKGRCARRTQVNPQYKAQRPPVPGELACQFPLAAEAAAAFGFPVIALPDTEADDIIATYTRLAREAGEEVVIVSTDKDFYQLIRPGVSLYDPQKQMVIDARHVVEKFGVSPEFMIDLQAMMGDPVDNVRGIEKVGKVGGAKLLHQYGSLENILANARFIKGKQGEYVARDAEQARLAKLQVTLDDQIPVTFTIADLAYKGFDNRVLLAFLDATGLPTLREEIVASLMAAA